MSSDDDLPIFRPRLGGARRSANASPVTGFRNAVLYGSFRAGAARGATLAGRDSAAGLARGARRVVVKAHVVRMSRGGAKIASMHLRYIQRGGVEKDGSPGVLYGADAAIVAERFEQPRSGERHQFRFIVSPEDADELDLTDYVRRYMQRIELDVGRRLEWAAVNHHDTEHPHAHIVVRGVDRDGAQVRFDRAYISHGMRYLAQELATEELALRTEREVARVRARETTQARFTSLDQELARRVVDGIVKPRDDNAAHSALHIARLRHLEDMRLAHRIGPNAWALDPNWQRDLRELGERGDILKTMHKALRGDPSRYRVVRSLDALDVTERTQLQGRLVDKGLSDELKGTYYAIVEGRNGRAYHVPVDARSFEMAKVGDTVSLDSADVRRGFTLRKGDASPRRGRDRS